jgi:tRNA pseudouridine32 synthase/23S rRNA pseudouridine746 synthase
MGNSVDIVYQDRHLVAVNKPSGLLSVPGRGEANQDSAATRLTKQFPNTRILHRLDQATSGLIVFPQSHRALSETSKAFQDRQVAKRYIAVVSGLVDADVGEINAPLMADWPNRPRQIVHRDGKPSLTKYQVLHRDHGKQQTRLILQPITGRTHQLRVHLEHIGHPIVGDQLYHPTALEDTSTRLLLHAEFISFRHPIFATKLSLCLPPAF